VTEQIRAATGEIRAEVVASVLGVDVAVVARSGDLIAAVEW
jgi:hypothetical protein